MSIESNHHFFFRRLNGAPAILLMLTGVGWVMRLIEPPRSV